MSSGAGHLTGRSSVRRLEGGGPSPQEKEERKMLGGGLGCGPVALRESIRFVSFGVNPSCSV